jgi:hypothetical protein
MFRLGLLRCSVALGWATASRLLHSTFTHFCWSLLCAVAVAAGAGCVQSLHRYTELLLLLTGRRPSELLPPTPPSYIVNRVWQLAQSTCVKDFNWVSIGEHFALVTVWGKGRGQGRLG